MTFKYAATISPARSDEEVEIAVRSDDLEEARSITGGEDRIVVMQLTVEAQHFVEVIRGSAPEHDCDDTAIAFRDACLHRAPGQEPAKTGRSSRRSVI